MCAICSSLDSDVLKAPPACATAHDLGSDPQIPRPFEEVPLHLYLAFFSISTLYHFSNRLVLSHYYTLQPSGIKREEALSQWQSRFATPDTGDWWYSGTGTGHGRG